MCPGMEEGLAQKESYEIIERKEARMQILEEKTFNRVLKVSKELSIGDSHRAHLQLGLLFAWLHISHGIWECLGAPSPALGKAKKSKPDSRSTQLHTEHFSLGNPKGQIAIHHYLFFGPKSQIFVSVYIYPKI